MLVRFTYKFLFASAVVVSLVKADFASAQVSMTAISRSKLERTSAFKKIRLHGACYYPTQGQTILGVISKDEFVPMDSTLRKEIARRSRVKQISNPLGAAVRRCIASASKYQTTTTTTITDAPPTGGEVSLAPSDAPSTPSSSPSPNIVVAKPVSNVPIPNIELWKNQMLSFGEAHCAEHKNNDNYNFDTRLLNTYYDAEWVYFQIADYTNNTYWLSCAAAARSVYRDQYVIPNDGFVTGYWNFSHGNTQNYLRTGDPVSKEAVVLNSKNAAFARDGTQPWETDSCLASRETAYAIMSYLNAEEVGEPRRERLAQLVDQALGHIDQWFVSKSCPYVKSFMVALTSQALIQYYAKTGDTRIPSAIETAANGLWSKTWDEPSQSFLYLDHPVNNELASPAPDLNLLIAPLYGWLYHQTGDVVYRDAGDRIFASGVENAYLVNAKQFNQNYRWSIQFVQWRSTAPLH